MPGSAVLWLQSDPPMCGAAAGQEAPGHMGSLDPIQNWVCFQRLGHEIGVL